LLVAVTRDAQAARSSSVRASVPLSASQRVNLRAKLPLGDAAVGVAPTVQFPHYFVMTKPKAGTKVELGSEVRLIIGDG
jgi:hypothetical protein